LSPERAENRNFATVLASLNAGIRQPRRWAACRIEKKVRIWEIWIHGPLRHTGSTSILCSQMETTMNATNILPLLLFLLSGVPIALALAGLLIDERATRAAAGAGATERTFSRTMQPAAEPRLSGARASVTVAAIRSRVSSATGTRDFPQAAQAILATVT
jgi:hypothetical protein